MVLRWQRRGRVGRRRDLMMRKPQRMRWGFRFLSGPSHRCAVGAARRDRQGLEFSLQAARREQAKA